MLTARMADLEAKPPTGFTAVNGRASPPQRNGYSVFKLGAAAEENRNSTSSNGVNRPRLDSAAEQRAPSRVEDSQPSSTAPLQRSGSPSRPASRSEGLNPERSPSRKRTYPEAFDDNAPQPYHARPAPRENMEQRSPERYHESSNQPQQANVSHPDRDRAEFDPHAAVQSGSPYSNDPATDDTERRLVAAMRASSGGADTMHEAYGPDDDDDDEDSMHQGSGGYPGGPEYSNTPTRTAAGVAMDAARKRKRVFSNRTKTGCLTCRKRKKKCDERHPECNNCLRGGFVCEGYSTRSPWQKPTPQLKQPPITIQSKNYGSTYGGTAQRAQQQSHYGEHSQEYGRGPETRPEDRHRDVAPMTVALPPPPPPPPPPPQEQIRQPYPRADGRYPNQLAPRYSEPDKRGHDIHNGDSAAHDPSIYPPPPSSTTYPSQQTHSHSVPPPPTAPMHTSAPAVAQAALQHVTSALPATNSSLSNQAVTARRPGEPSERDRMLQGAYYLPYTSALMLDRDACAAACWRFNQACLNPTLGFTHADRERLFREIVSLRPLPDQAVVGSPAQNGQNGSSHESEDAVRAGAVVPQGQVGSGCVVEGPFHCDYGYNLCIGNDVVINANCRITDTCSVTIGNGVVLSQGVALMCTTYGIDPKDRRKGKGRALGRGIVIEDDAWIGTNVTILPGVTVGKGSTVGAGSLVHKDVPPYTVMAGNPPKVVRGIGGEESRGL